MGPEKEQIFADLYQSQYRSIYMHIYTHLNNHHLAEDMTHDVFMACYKNLDNYDETKASLTTWIYVIANNKLKNYYRDKKVNADIDEFSEIIPDEKNTIEDQAVFVEQCRELLADLLEELNDKARQVVIKTYFQEKSSIEVAKELDMTPVNVRVTLKRALDKLKEKIVAKGLNADDFGL